MQTVAHHAGVSLMTVSNVINNPDKVSEATRSVVHEAIEALGYRPNQFAKALASARSERIGFLYSNLNKPFVSGILMGAMKAANRSGTNLYLSSPESYDIEKLRQTITTMVMNGVNAVLISPPNAETLHRSGFLADLAVPVAAVGAATPLQGLITVRVDDRAAARDMTEYLIGQGHRRIAFIGGPESHSSAFARLEGFYDAHAGHGLPVDPLLVRAASYSFASAVQPAQELLALADRPTAVFASTDEMAAAVIAMAHQQRLSIPDDIAIVGYDDSPLASVIWPTLTTIRQPVEEMGQRAAELLMSAVRGNSQPADHVMPHTLIKRDSG